MATALQSFAMLGKVRGMRHAGNDPGMNATAPVASPPWPRSSPSTFCAELGPPGSSGAAVSERVPRGPCAAKALAGSSMSRCRSGLAAWAAAPGSDWSQT